NFSLLLLCRLQVFTSASTVAFKTFACDEEVVDGKSYLRADYSISCTTSLHMMFKAYAGIMILVYPVGIPVLYALILWKDRELLNPRIHVEPDEADEAATTADAAGRDQILPRLVLLRGDRVRPEDSVDGIAHFHRPPHRDASGYGLPVCLRFSSGVRAHAAPHGPSR
ncbi:unnamed protein product, partial [Laminaria digitata]